MLVLTVESIDLYYGAAQALRRVSVAAEPGKITCVLGRNGVGKSSLLRAIVGHQPVRAGRVAARRPGHHAAQGLRAGPPRHRLRAAGARDLSAAHRAREPGDRLCPPARQRARHLRRAVRPVPHPQVHARAGAAAISPAASSSSSPSPARSSPSRACWCWTSRPRASSPPSSRTSAAPSPTCASRARWRSCWSSSISISPAQLADTYAVMERGEVVLAGKGAEMVESDVRRYLTV